MSLVIKSVPDGWKVGLEDKAALIRYLEGEKPNGGDGTCGCGGCIAFWALHNFVEPQRAEQRGDKDEA